VVLRLTPKAERLFEELHPALWDALHATYGGLGKDEIRQLTVLLRRPLAALEG
jgi:DNA-binding MarR family transcriptional regulator